MMTDSVLQYPTRHEGVSVVIKAYNEGNHIQLAIGSVLQAADEIVPLPLDVVVADGGSTDATVAKAVAMSRYAPVRVMQLRYAADRTCGAGVELGFSHCGGRWVLLMDGDMTLEPGFLGKALAYLRTHPQVAGVAGGVRDRVIRNGTDRIRANNGLGQEVGLRPWLEGGGLYRRKAIEDAGGYAADARLAAFEEADLGLRLRRAGWQLHRLSGVGTWHDGHALGTLDLLKQRWRQGRMAAAGTLLRLHVTQKHRQDVLRLLMQPLIMSLWWVLMGLAWATNILAQWCLASLMGLTWLCLKKGDVRHVLASVLDWHAMLAGVVHGLLRPLPRRSEPLAAYCWADGASGKVISVSQGPL
jgi:GT2 family glycosyltransferase